MTDKQMIIDGVRVDECCYFDYENDGYEDSCYIYQNECSAQNCYYKQLKRKEQECETLASQLDFEVQKKECLEQECEELKEKNIGLNKDWEEKKNLAYEITCKNEKLKQTLKEIKEIANRIYSEVITENWQSLLAKQILQKISEVIDEDN